MQIPILTTCFCGPAWATSAVMGAAFSLPFNPVKLVFLIVWFYVCLYCAQYVQFSPLVSKRYRAVASLTALLAGPLIFPVLLLIDVIATSLESRRNMFDVLGDKLHAIMDSLAEMAPGRSKVDNSIMLLDSSGRSLTEIYGHSRNKTQDSHVLDLTEDLIRNALDDEASDILIDPRDNTTYSVRFRVDGVLRTTEEFDSDTCAAVINSIKAVSGMDIAERRRPQDGAFIARTGGGTVSFRVASAGVLNGEPTSHLPRPCEAF